MAERNINGKDVLLFKHTDSDDATSPLLPVGCLTNLTVGRSRSTNATETKCGTLNSEGSVTYSASADSIVIWGNDPTAKIQHTDLVDYFNTEGSQLWYIGPATPVDGDNIIEFKGTISALNDTYGATGFATFAATFNPDPQTWTETKYVVPSTDVTLTKITIAPGNITKSSSFNLLYEFRVDAHSSATLSALSIVLNGTFDAGDLGNLTVIRGNTQDLIGSTTQQTIAGGSLVSGATVNFNSVSTAVDDETVVYFAVAADIPSGADTGHTIIAAAPIITITSGGTIVNNISGAAGTQTIQ